MARRPPRSSRAGSCSRSAGGALRARADDRARRGGGLAALARGDDVRGARRADRRCRVAPDRDGGGRRRRARGAARPPARPGAVHAAGVVGAVAAAVSLSSLPVFWHGVVISALPATLARAVCALAIVGGAAAAALSFLPDFDEPVRVAEAAAAMSAFLAGDRAPRRAPSVHPWPIGPGPRYTPPARTAAVAAGKPVGVAALRARRHDLPGPPRAVRRPQGGRRPGGDRRRAVRAASTRSRTTDARRASSRSRRARACTLGDLFRIWGQPLGAHRLASFRSRAPVRAYVGGRLVRGPARRDPAHAARPDRARARRLRRPPFLLPLPRR